MQQNTVTNRNSFTHIEREPSVFMQDGAILNIGAGANANLIVISTDDGIIPDAGQRAYPDFANHHRAWRYESGLIDNRPGILKQVNHVLISLLFLYICSISLSSQKSLESSFVKKEAAF
jgi:hypothetical protein